MEKKNTLVITVLAVVVLLVLVLTATFAYFAATIQGNGNTGNVINVNATLANSESVFLVSSNGNIAVSVTPGQMAEGAAVDETTAKNTSVAVGDDATQTLTVDFTGGDATTSSTMYYDLMFEWTSADKYTAATEGLASHGSKEITLTITAEGATGTTSKEETNIASTTDVTGILASGETKAMIGHASITSSGSKVTQTYTAVAKIYNVDLDQSAIAGKTFTGRVYVDNVTAKTHTH